MIRMLQAIALSIAFLSSHVLAHDDKPKPRPESTKDGDPKKMETKKGDHAKGDHKGKDHEKKH